MVRTLDFHSNNVGSIPASLIHLPEFFNPKFNKRTNNAGFKTSRFDNNLRYSLKFATLYAPGSLLKTTLILKKSYCSKSRRNKKILIKQSYFILAWLCYVKSSKYNKKPSFFVYPPRSYKTTLIKSPMAQKTYSQEQFVVKYWLLGVSFFSSINSLRFVKSLDKSLFFLRFTILNIPYISTNMILLKKLHVSYFSSSSYYFSFYSFNHPGFRVLKILDNKT